MKDWLSPPIWGIYIFILVVRISLSLKPTQGKQPRVEDLEEDWASVYKDNCHMCMDSYHSNSILYVSHEAQKFGK